MNYYYIPPKISTYLKDVDVVVNKNCVPNYNAPLTDPEGFGGVYTTASGTVNSSLVSGASIPLPQTYVLLVPFDKPSQETINYIHRAANQKEIIVVVPPIQRTTQIAT